LLIPALAAAGGSGFALAKGRRAGLVGVRLTKAAAARSVEPVSASKPSGAVKTARGRTATATTKNNSYGYVTAPRLAFESAGVEFHRRERRRP